MILGIKIYYQVLNLLLIINLINFKGRKFKYKKNWSISKILITLSFYIYYESF